MEIPWISGWDWMLHWAQRRVFSTFTQRLTRQSYTVISKRTTYYWTANIMQRSQILESRDSSLKLMLMNLSVLMCSHAWKERLWVNVIYLCLSINCYKVIFNAKLNTLGLSNELSFTYPRNGNNTIVFLFIFAGIRWSRIFPDPEVDRKKWCFQPGHRILRNLDWVETHFSWQAHRPGGINNVYLL